MNASRARAAGLLVFVLFVILESQMWDSPDVEVFGLDVPAWLMGLVFYVLGLLAGAAAERSKSKPS